MKYELIPLSKNNPNFKNTQNKVTSIPINVIDCFTISFDSMVIVKNRRIKAVPTKAMVGETTIKLKPIAALISLIVRLLLDY